jgi:hypothetical protein
MRVPSGPEVFTGMHGSSVDIISLVSLCIWPKDFDKVIGLDGLGVCGVRYGS